MSVLNGNLDLLIVGFAGTAGTERILAEKPEDVRARFGKAYLTEEIMELMTKPRLRFSAEGLSAQHLYVFTESGEAVPEDEADLQAKKNAGEIWLSDIDNLIPGMYQTFGIRKLREIGKGGVLAALWDFLEEESVDAEGKKTGKPVGCEFRYRDIPLLSITLELCELFNLNPYRLQSENCFLLAAERGTQLRDSLRAHGIHSEIFGRTTAEKQRVRVDSPDRGFLQKSHKDELEKVVEITNR